MAGLYIPGYSDFQQAAGNVRASEQHDLRQRAGQVHLQGILQQQNAVAQKQRDLAEFEASLPPAERLKFRINPAEYLKNVRPDPQGQAAMQLSGLLAGATVPQDRPGQFVPTEDAALAQFGVKKNPDGTYTQVGPAPTEPTRVYTPDPNVVRGLAVQAEPEKAIPKVLDALNQKPLTPRQQVVPVTGGYLDENRQFVRTAPEPQPRAEPAPSFIVTQDPKSPTGWSHRNTRTGELSPGAPPPSSATPKPPRPMPAPLQKQLTEVAELVDATERFTSTFKEHYGGKTFTGDLGNQWGKIFGDDTGQAQWWQDYELHQSQVRNRLFGSALTTAEIEAWNKSAINPRMDSGEIKKNLGRREVLERKGYAKLTNFAEKSGFPKEQIEALTGRPIGGATPTLPGQTVNPQSVLDQADAILRGTNGNR